MKITSVETFIAGLDRRNYLFVRVQTDEGIHGIGEAYSCGPDDATAAVVADFETWLVGQDPRDARALRHLLYAGSRAGIVEPVRALEMAEALKPYRPFFFEEALRPENIDAMAEVKARSPIPIATGEMLYTKFQFRELLEKRGADIIQPDVCIAG